MAAGEQERDEVRQELEGEKEKNSDGRKEELTAKVEAKDALLAKVKEMREKAAEIEEVTREVQRVSDGRSLTSLDKFFLHDHDASMSASFTKKVS